MRILTLLFVASHLLLRAVAVPHVHEVTHHTPADCQAGRLHVHLLHGHHRHAHQEAGHDHGHAGDDCCCDDEDVFPIDADFPLESPAGRQATPLRQAVAWISSSAAAVSTDPMAAWPARRGGRPPGERTCSHHDSLPQVLQV